MNSELESEERDKQIIMKKIAYTEKQIKKLEDSKGDVSLIHKYKRNIELYEKKLNK